MSESAPALRVAQPRSRESAAEVFRFGAEWVVRALNGEFREPGRDVRHYVHSDGRTTDHTANPTWWLGTVPAQIADAREARDRTPGRPASAGATL